MKTFNENENEVVEGENYFVVCDDGLVRFLLAEDVGSNFLEFVFYDVHGDEKYRTYSPYLIYKLGELE